MDTASSGTWASRGLREIWRGMRLGWVPIVLTVLAHVPGRRVYAMNEGLHGRPAWQFFCAGLVCDLIYVGPPVVMAFAIASALGKTRTKARIATALLAIALLLSAWMFSVAAIESKLERGLYPTYLETKTALASSSFVAGSWPTLLLDRYWKTSLVVLAVSAALLVFHRRRAERELRSRTSAFGFALAGVLVLGACGGLVRREREVFPRTGGYVETRSPLETIAVGGLALSSYAPTANGMREVLASEAHTFSAEERRAGVRALGYPASSADRLFAFEQGEPCDAPHPLARPLDRNEESESAAGDLLGDIEALSTDLFGARKDPIIVWQVVMESFRGDDVHAVQPLAPAELTPVMTRLYADRARTIAFRRAYQSGLRSAHNVSALMCGVGNVPFNMAIARDLGHVPLRCLPDVLSDGGFDTHAFYGADLAFDNMLEFFRYHGVKTSEGADLPAGLPTGSWGVSDRALVARALAHPEPTTRSQYRLVLTLSGHAPFARPTDIPDEVLERTRVACKRSPSAQEDDCTRLAVIAYADHAVGELLDQLERSPLGARSIVVVSADHATSEMFLWRGSSEDEGRGHVPYLVYVPRALADSSAHPEAITARVERLHDRAATQVFSLADSPSLVTALLSGTRELRGIPTPWRFHTYGGHVTSPHFALHTTPGAAIWGTDSSAFVFSADAAGAVTAHEIRNRGFTARSDFAAMNVSLRGPAAALSSFTKGYVRRCEKDARIRMGSHHVGDSLPN